MIEWKPIETIPDDSTQPILVFMPKGHRGHPSCEVMIVFWAEGPDGRRELAHWTNGGPNGGDDWDFRCCPDEAPTHWMPLPKPPSEG